MKLSELIRVIAPEQRIRLYVPGVEGVAYEGEACALSREFAGRHTVHRIGDSGIRSLITIIIKEDSDEDAT